MSSRALKKPLIGIAIVLVIGVGVSWLLFRKAQERKEFVSPVDRASGARCRFAVSAAWNRKDFPDAPGIVPGALFTDPQSAIRHWIATHLFRQAAILQNQSVIDLRIIRASEFKFNLQIQAGYPELISGSPASLHVFSHRHLWIDGHPATVVTASTANRSVYGTVLLVYVPDGSIAYIVDGYSSSSDAAQIDHEMQTIISGFRVEKVAPADGKR